MRGRVCVYRHTRGTCQGHFWSLVGLLVQIVSKRWAEVEDDVFVRSKRYGARWEQSVSVKARCGELVSREAMQRRRDAPLCVVVVVIARPSHKGGLESDHKL